MKLRVARHHNGIGDWWLLLAALRWLRKQHPDVEVIVDFRNAPRIAQDAYAMSDLAFQDARVCTDEPDVALAHVMAPLRSSEPYLHAFARVLSEATDREVEPDMSDLPFAHVVHSPGTHLTMVGHGKGIKRGGKEWGRENFTELAAQLRAKSFEIYQLGGPRDFELPDVHHSLGCTFGNLVALLASSRAFIGLENALMVLAGFLRVPQVTIYDGAPGADRVAFEHQLKIRERISPRDAYERIIAWIEP